MKVLVSGVEGFETFTLMLNKEEMAAVYAGLQALGKEDKAKEIKVGLEEYL